MHLGLASYNFTKLKGEKRGEWQTFSLHDPLGIPYDRIGVEIFCWIKPEVELLLSVSLPLGKHIGMKNIRVSTKVSQELKINLIMCLPLRRQLQKNLSMPFHHVILAWLVQD